MSKRRIIGDIVEVKNLEDRSPYLARIVEHGSGVDPDDCILDCGDPDCKEWPLLHLVDAKGNPTGDRSHHVPECQMFDVL